MRRWLPLLIILVLAPQDTRWATPLQARAAVLLQAPEPEITETALGAAVLGAEDNRARTPDELSTILEGTRSGTRRLKLVSIRALGRLERRDVLPSLLPFLRAPEAAVRIEAAHAIAQAMRGAPAAGDAGAQQLDDVLTTLLAAAGTEETPSGAAALAVSLARIPCTRSEQVARVEGMLLSMLQLSRSLRVRIRDADDAETVMAGALRGFELLPRVQRTLYSPSESTISALRGFASGTASAGWAGVADRLRGPAFYAAVSARAVDADTLRPNLTYGRDAMVRRAAVAMLAGAGSPLDGDERADALRAALADVEGAVRYEAVRGYTRHLAPADGCARLVQMLNDPVEHVVLAVLGALGEACRADEGSLTALVAEARTPPEVGGWRRESHAVVALARRSSTYAAAPLATHARHGRWQVRMYAARAAAVLNDIGTLERLAFDPDDNVREAALVPLKRLKGNDVEPILLAALGRDDYQLLRTAARETAGLPPSERLADALLDALVRITAQRRDTSRDPRLALLEALRSRGGERHVSRLRPLLQDFDPRVAQEAAAAITAWTGETVTATPVPLPRQPLPSAEELQTLRTHDVVLVMENGRDLTLRLDVDRAPLTAVRFLRLANANYYDGLTFHRVAPNFVLQGGSPGANEYMGDGPYLRDEISSRTHARGTVGLSTRGRDTGDAQLFINLVPNQRLDFDYTLFGEVVRSAENIDVVGEGDRITDVRFVRRRGR